LAPENTLAAFHLAVEAYRADILELDVRPSADGHVVVFHDETLDRTTGVPGRVDACTLAELQALDAGWPLPACRGQGVAIPTLDQVLSAFPTTHLNVELKDGTDRFLEVFRDVVERHGAEERVCVGHVEERYAQGLRRLLPRCAFFYPREPASLFVAAVRSGAPAPVDDRWDVLSLPRLFAGHQVVTAELVQVAHAQGKAVHVWTVDEEEEMRQWVAAGVDAIITDRPDVLRAVLGG
jgi:glycerophosphoryl diester phosphodiesterase